MDELQISGKRFISARRIARENGYTSDYIGQLIRGGKITGQKVGRAWYVDAASFDKYLGSETPSPAETSAPNIEEAPVAQLAVADEKTEEAALSESEVVVVAEEKEEAPIVVAAAELVPEPVAMAEETVESVLETVAPEVETLPEPEPAVQHIPLRLFKKEEKRPEKETSTGLRYYADDMPALPEITSNKKESRVAVPVVSEEESEVFVVHSQPKRTQRFMLGGLVLASIMIFVFCAVVSSALSLNLTISEGNTASASYGLTW